MAFFIIQRLNFVTTTISLSFVLVSVFRSTYAHFHGEQSSIGNLEISSVMTPEGNWTNRTLETGKVAYYAFSGAEATISCHARFPIQWNISGNINATAVVFTYTDGLVDALRNDFRIFFLLRHGEITEVPAISLEVACEKVGYPTHQKSVYIFMGADPSSNSQLSLTKSQFVIESVTTAPMHLDPHSDYSHVQNQIEIIVPERQSSRNQSISCRSNSEIKYMVTVRCRDSYDCRFRTKCFRDPTKQCYVNEGSHGYYEYFHYDADSNNTHELLASRTVGSGIAQCVLQSGQSTSVEFFQSLSHTTYYSFTDAPETELLRIVDIDPVLYSNRSTTFRCEFVRYLFQQNIVFKLEFANKSVQFLHKSLQSTSSVKYNVRNLTDSRDVLELDIHLPLDSVAVHCQASWPNSTDVVTSTKRFQIRSTSTPTIKDAGKTEQITLGACKKSVRLTCPGSGEPALTYSWLRKNQNGDFENVPVIYPDLYSGTDKAGRRYLLFPVATSAHSGYYKCIGKNQLGQVEKEFKLTVEDDFFALTVICIILGIACSIMTTLSTIFILLWRRSKLREVSVDLLDASCKNLKELLASEMWRNYDLMPDSSGEEFELTEALCPMDMEIPLANIEFGDAAENFLGTGEFSYVVKANLLPDKNEVAVKGTKGTVSASQFKLLLDEVKIMIYIGSHRNILRLIGVCTEQIRQKRIHLVTELCGIGSLDQFLISSRSSFINLFPDDKQLKKVSVVKSEVENICTLDLIKFAAQIANGMAYLESKSIVHADLAARNVLLTAEKTVKISDFGLSRKYDESTMYIVENTMCPRPWRWMSPENLSRMTFSTQSDVWSYGITLYEVFSLGNIPYPNYVSWTDDFFLKLKNGMRMNKPKYCNTAIYQKMTWCWEAEPRDRPRFSELCTYFEEILHNF